MIAVVVVVLLCCCVVVIVVVVVEVRIKPAGKKALPMDTHQSEAIVCMPVAAVIEH